MSEALRIGSVDDPDEGFTRIGTVWVSPAAEIYVVERSEPEIRVYDRGGALLRSYGRGGDGPGEFNSIGRFGLLGDTLWVSDGGQSRTTLFSLDGRLLQTVTGRLDVAVGELMGMPLTVRVFPDELRPDGLLGSRFVNRSWPNLPDSFADIPRVLFDRDGRVIDTIEMVPTRISPRARALRFEQTTSYVYPEAPAHDSGTYTRRLESGTFTLHWEVSGQQPTGSVTAERRDSGGSVGFHRSVRYEPRPITDRYLDSLELFEAQRSAMRRPPHHPPLRPPLVFEDETVWARFDPMDAEVNRWLVFDGRDDVLSSVSLPLGALPKWSDGEDVWLVEVDELDVPWLVRYRIAPAANRTP